MLANQYKHLGHNVKPAAIKMKSFKWLLSNELIKWKFITIDVIDGNHSIRPYLQVKNWIDIFLWRNFC